MVPRKWTSSQMPLFGPMHPCSNGNKRDILRLPWRGQLPAPADWRPAASLEDGMDQNCGTTWGHQKGPNILIILDVPKMCVFDSVFHVS